MAMMCCFRTQTCLLDSRRESALSQSPRLRLLGRYKYTVRSFRKASNGSGVLYSSPSVASRRSRLSFELFLYAEMLMIFALGAALTLMAMLTVGYVVIRALGLRRFFVMEDAELVAPPGGARENRGEGDHRRHIVGTARRRRGAALRRINSHGDS
ncbi:uncharacterized protein LOC144180250 [Haemaphysalis longicornis]